MPQDIRPSSNSGYQRAVKVRRAYETKRQAKKQELVGEIEESNCAIQLSICIRQVLAAKLCFRALLPYSDRKAYIPSQCLTSLLDMTARHIRMPITSC